MMVILMMLDVTVNIRNLKAMVYKNVKIEVFYNIMQKNKLDYSSMGVIYLVCT